MKLFVQRLVVGPRPPEDDDAADLLDDGGVGAFGELRGERVALVAVAGQSGFDQAVRRQRAVDFRDDGVGGAGLTDVHDGFERVRARFEMGALARPEGDGHSQ